MISVEPISAFSDNYIWLIRRSDSSCVTIVDPGDATPVLKKCQAENLQIESILITHHHSDHIGGVAAIKSAFPDAIVYGPASEQIPMIGVKLGEGDVVSLPGPGVEYTVMDVPGHTAGHIAYYGNGQLFCGDTLFACGCGRVLGGSLSTLCQSLQKIAALPATTMAYCAHEYTLDNIGFAKWVEPNNPDLLQREKDDFSKIDQDLPTVPSLIGIEQQTNPFLRFHLPDVKNRVEKQFGRPLATDCDVFSALRTWKDSEYD